jgi:hypothetical protein
LQKSGKKSGSIAKIIHCSCILHFKRVFSFSFQIKEKNKQQAVLPVTAVLWVWENKLSRKMIIILVILIGK